MRILGNTAAGLPTGYTSVLIQWLMRRLEKRYPAHDEDDSGVHRGDLENGLHFPVSLHRCGHRGTEAIVEQQHSFERHPEIGFQEVLVSELAKQLDLRVKLGAECGRSYETTLVHLNARAFD